MGKVKKKGGLRGREEAAAEEEEDAPSRGRQAEAALQQGEAYKHMNGEGVQWGGWKGTVKKQGGLRGREEAAAA
jgi:hypothetical protein